MSSCRRLTVMVIVMTNNKKNNNINNNTVQLFGFLLKIGLGKVEFCLICDPEYIYIYIYIVYNLHIHIYSVIPAGS